MGRSQRRLRQAQPRPPLPGRLPQQLPLRGSGQPRQPMGPDPRRRGRAATDCGRRAPARHQPARNDLRHPFTVNPTGAGYGSAVEGESGTGRAVASALGGMGDPARTLDARARGARPSRRCSRRRRPRGSTSHAQLGSSAWRGASLPSSDTPSLSAPASRTSRCRRGASPSRSDLPRRRCEGIDAWLSSTRRFAAREECPQGPKAAIRRLEQAAFEFARPSGTKSGGCATLEAIGAVEAALARSSSAAESVRPLRGRQRQRRGSRQPTTARRSSQQQFASPRYATEATERRAEQRPRRVADDARLHPRHHHRARAGKSSSTQIGVAPWRAEPDPPPRSAARRGATSMRRAWAVRRPSKREPGPHLRLPDCSPQNGLDDRIECSRCFAGWWYLTTIAKLRVARGLFGLRNSRERGRRPSRSSN